MSEYSIDSIKSLSFKEGVRARVQMYLGSDDIEGTYQALKEIINNSTDEALAGYGKQIDISINEATNHVSVRDYGRGVPFGIKDDGSNVLVDIYTKSHTGGKFDNDVYKNASGLNGIGGSCVCLTSTEFTVQSFRDGKTAIAKFKKGDLVDYKEKSAKTAKSGTLVEFIPDREVFKNGDIGYSFKRICADIKDISYLYPGIVFSVTNELTNEVVKYCQKNGIVDFVKDNVATPIHKQIMTASAKDDYDSVEIAFMWGVKYETSYVFVNGLRCPEGGSPITGAKSSITRTFNNLAGAEFDGESIRKNLFYVINCKVTNPSFANQTKTKINNPSLRTLASEAFGVALKEMCDKYRKDFDTVAEMLKKIEKAEIAAEKARQAVLGYQKEVAQSEKKKYIASDKLRDARTLGQNSILLVNEGLSAGGSMSQGRDPDKYGILMLRGKAINALSNSIEDILANEEVKLLLQALGIVYGKPYNASKLRYGKVAIATDADFDGR